MERAQLLTGQSRERIARSAVRAAYFGFFVDMFEIYLPITVLAPALVYFVPPGIGAQGRATILSLTFAVSLIGRPIGAFIFGHFGDRLGRRRATLVSACGFSVATLLIGLLPGQAAWGDAAIAALLVLRLIAGAFVGGEYTAANPLAMEYSRKERRGVDAALIHVGYPAALVCISLLGSALLRLIPLGGPESHYAVWGWRIPFGVGALLGGGLFLYYFLRVPESDVWHASSRGNAPLRELFARSNRARLAQLFVVMSGAWLTLDATVGALPGVLGTVLGASTAQVNAGILLGAGCVIPAFPLIGMLGQQIGRRRTILLGGIVNLAPVCVLYYLLIAGGYRAPATLVGLVALVIGLSMLLWPVITAYLTESFRTEIRASGYGISFSLAAALPGLYSFYMLGLARWIAYPLTPIALLALGGLLLCLGALAGPETKHVDLAGEPAPKSSTALWEAS